jgi:deglycase
MAKILSVIVPNGFRDEEYDIPKKLFEENGHEVITCSDQPGPLTGKLGKVTANVDILLADVNSSDYDAIVVVGGQNYFWNNELLLNILKEMNATDKIIGAICISGCIPAQAGLLTGKKCTVFETPDSVKEIEKNGAIYSGEPVTVERNIVTANNVDVSREFAKEILKLL